MFIFRVVLVLMLIGVIGQRSSAQSITSDKTSNRVLLNGVSPTDSDDIQVFVTKVIGDSPEILTSGGGVWGHSWSPNGQSVLVTRMVDGYVHLFRSDGRDRKLVPLTHGAASYLSPLWSPDGAWIAAVMILADSEKLVLLSPDGVNSRVLVEGDVTLGAWSPDSRYLAFQAADKQLWVMDIQTLAASPINLSDFKGDDLRITDWHGSEIAFTLRTHTQQVVYILTVNTSTVRRAVPDDLSHHHSLQWASDGSHFLYLSNRDGGRSAVYRVSMDGTQVEQLPLSMMLHPHTGLAYWTPPLRDVPQSTEIEGAVWTAFGEKVVVDSQDPISSARYALEVVLSGRLEEEPTWVCPELLDLYLDISEAARADFADIDLSDMVFSVVLQDTVAAQLNLTGVMSLRVAGARRDFVASVLPVDNNPITTAYLTYAGGWQLCTPL